MKPWPDSLPDDGVFLWICRDLFSERVEGALGFLVPEEQERALGYRFEADRRRYLAGTLLQRVVLAHYLACPLREVSFLKNKWGKPGVDADTGLKFSLSRSHQVAVLGVGTGGELGVDVEFEGELDLGVQREFSETEQEFIENASDSTRAFFEIWARKEAYIKGVGRGLSHPLGQFDVSECGVRDWSESSPSESWKVSSVELAGAGYAVAIATPVLIPTIEIIEIVSDELLDCLGVLGGI